MERGISCAWLPLRMVPTGGASEGIDSDTLWILNKSVSKEGGRAEKRGRSKVDRTGQGYKSSSGIIRRLTRRFGSGRGACDAGSATALNNRHARPPPHSNDKEGSESSMAEVCGSPARALAESGGKGVESLSMPSSARSEWQMTP